MKTIYLIRAEYDGGVSDQIAKQLLDSRTPFKELIYTVSPLPWDTISAVPCVVIDVDGQICEIEEHRTESPFDFNRCLVKIGSSPTTMEKPAETKTPTIEAMITDMEQRIMAEIAKLKS